MSKVQYVIDGVYPDDAYDLCVSDARLCGTVWELKALAEHAAEDYWDNHDGWESNWPLNIEIFIDGARVDIYKVGMEIQSVFFADAGKSQQCPL